MPKKWVSPLQSIFSLPCEKSSRKMGSIKRSPTLAQGGGENQRAEMSSVSWFIKCEALELTFFSLVGLEILGSKCEVAPSESPARYWSNSARLVLAVKVRCPISKSRSFLRCASEGRGYSIVSVNRLNNARLIRSGWLVAPNKKTASGWLWIPSISLQELGGKLSGYRVWAAIKIVSNGLKFVDEQKSFACRRISQ